MLFGEIEAKYPSAFKLDELKIWILASDKVPGPMMQLVDILLHQIRKNTHCATLAVR